MSKLCDICRHKCKLLVLLTLKCLYKSCESFCQLNRVGSYIIKKKDIVKPMNEIPYTNKYHSTLYYIKFLQTITQNEVK